MARKNATYRIDNGVGWDEIMFETTADQVEGLQINDYYTPSIVGGWVNIDGNNPVKVWKDKLGQVHISGSIANGLNETAPIYLPKEYWPKRQLDFACIQQRETDGPARVRIREDGVVIIYKSSGSIYVDFAEIIYKSRY